MAKDASVAPKERVNIVYKSNSGDNERTVELPLKQVVLGEFTDKYSDKRIDERESVDINKDNFNEVLKAHDVKVDMAVSNKLVDDPEAQINVSLDFKTMKDFGPEAVAHKVPELEKILKLRDALMALKGPLSNIPEFRNKIQTLIEDEAGRAQLLKELGLDKEE